MSEISKPHLGKKRYIAIAALASLVATGGVIGATVTSESTIAGNQITVTDNTAPTDAVVTVTGSLIDLSLERGVIPKGQISYPGSSIEQVEINGMSWTLTNSGETDATVKLLPLDVQIPADADIEPAAVATFSAFASADGSGVALRQKIGAHDAGVTVQNTITVPAGKSVTVTGRFTFSTKSFIPKMKTYDKTFDLQFDYVNKQ